MRGAITLIAPAGLSGARGYVWRGVIMYRRPYPHPHDTSSLSQTFPEISQHRPQLRAAQKIFKYAEMFPCERILHLWKWTFFSTSPPSARSAEMFWNAIEQSFIFINPAPNMHYPPSIILLCRSVNIHSLFSINSKEKARAARKLYWLYNAFCSLTSY